MNNMDNNRKYVAHKLDVIQGQARVLFEPRMKAWALPGRKFTDLSDLALAYAINMDKIMQGAKIV